MQIFTDPDGNSLQQTDGETGAKAGPVFGIELSGAISGKTASGDCFLKKWPHCHGAQESGEGGDGKNPRFYPGGSRGAASHSALPAWFYCG